MELRDVCLVVALTPGGEVLLSREYKHGAGDVIATLPAGFVEPAEEPAAAARRELAEETGHAAAVLEPLGSQWLFPSFAGARAHFFLARDVRPAGVPHPDEFETIEVRAVPLAELRADGKSPAPRHLTDVCSRLGVALALARLDGGPGGGCGARA